MSSGTNLLIGDFLPDFGDMFCDFTELILRRWMILIQKMEQQMFKISDNKFVMERLYIWLVVWNMNLFFHILGTMIPTDEVIFF